MAHDQIYQYVPLWGSWEIDYPIGKGSFGSVYKISREEMGHKYEAAVKIISVPNEEQYREAEHTLGNDPGTLTLYFEDLVKNIVNEVGVLYSLSGNSNVINYQDHKVIKRSDGIGWDILIRMEYVTSLREFIKSHQMSRGEIIRLGIDICSALEICSKKAIIHRDIKDENIFVNEDGVFKLGDFGISKELSKSGRAASMRGTPLYMAPEVYRGEKYDAAVDIYSLGIVLYKLLNHGRLPFMPSYPEAIRFKDSEEAMEKRLNGNPFPDPDQAGEVLSQVVLKACAFKAVDRYQTASELKHELKKVLNSLSDAELIDLLTLKLDSGNRSSTNEETANEAASAIDATQSAFHQINQTESVNSGPGISSSQSAGKSENITGKRGKKISKRPFIIAVAALVIIVSGAILTVNYFVPLSKYNEAVQLKKLGEYLAAADQFSALGTFKDSSQMYTETCYLEAQSNFSSGKYDEASKLFLELGDYKDSSTLAKESKYQQSGEMISNKMYRDAIGVLEGISSYKDSADKIENCHMVLGDIAFGKADYVQAIAEYSKLVIAEETTLKIEECNYLLGKKYFDEGDFEKALQSYTLAGEYEDTANQIVLTKYSFANELNKDQQYQDAIDLYIDLGDYEDSKNQLKINKYLLGEQLYSKEQYYEAAKLFMEVYPYEKSLDYCKQAADKLKTINSDQSNELLAFVNNNTQSAKKAVSSGVLGITQDRLQGTWIGESETITINGSGGYFDCTWWPERIYFNQIHLENSKLRVGENLYLDNDGINQLAIYIYYFDNTQFKSTNSGVYNKQ